MLAAARFLDDRQRSLKERLGVGEASLFATKLSQIVERQCNGADHQRLLIEWLRVRMTSLNPSASTTWSAARARWLGL